MKDKLQEIGKIGEDIIRLYLLDNNRTITGTNWFDSTKDLILDNHLKCEIKTQVPWLVQDSFTFEVGQLNKILNSDIVYFISIPAKYANGEPDRFSGHIFECNNPAELKYRLKETNAGKKMYLVERTQPALKSIHIISKESQDKLAKLSKSTYAKRKVYK